MLPFIQIDSKWYVDIHWRPGLRIGQNIELRPLSRREAAWLEPELENAAADVWGRLFKDDAAIRDGAIPPEEG